MTSMPRFPRIILAAMALLLVGLTALVVREAPARADHDLGALRLGVEGPVDCDDPASCIVPDSIGRARIPGDRLRCEDMEAPREQRCRIEMGGQPLVIEIRFTGPEDPRVTECLSATHGATEIPCQAISYHPRGEVAIGSTLGLSDAELQGLRRRYPLSQMSNGAWWLSLLASSLTLAGLFGVGIWLATRQSTWLLRLMLTAVGSIVGLVGSLVLVVGLALRLGIPLD